MRSDSFPPTATLVVMRLELELGNGEPDLAIVDQQRVPWLDGGRILRMRQVGALGVSRRRRPHPSTNVSPGLTAAEPPANVPRRSFGPCRWIGVFRSAARCRVRRHGSFPRFAIRFWLVSLILMRKTSAPALNSFAIMSSIRRSGPSVATIFGAAQTPHCLAPPAEVATVSSVDADFPSGARGVTVARGLFGGVRQLHVQERCSLVSTSRKPVRS